MRRPTCPRTRQVLRAQEDARVYAELQSKQRAAYGDDEAAREAAGKAALLRAKESLSTGWRARLCYKQRVQKRMRNITPLVIQFSLGASSGILQSVWQKTQSLWCSSHLSMHSACRARPHPHRQWVRPASGPSWSSAAAAQQRHERLDGACLSDGHLVVRRGENEDELLD